MRVDPSELRSIIRTVAKSHRRESSGGLDATYYDIDTALEEAGFALDRFQKTGELERMVLVACHADPPAADHTELLARLESAIGDAALGEEIHAIAADPSSVALEFIDRYADRFYTGRIEARLQAETD